MKARLGAVGRTTEHVVNRVFTMSAPYSKAKVRGFSLVADAVGLKMVNLPVWRRQVPGLNEWRLHVFGYESDVEFFDFLLCFAHAPDDEGLCEGLRRHRPDLLDRRSSPCSALSWHAGCTKPARLRIVEQPDAPGTDIVLADRSELIMKARRARATRCCARAHRSAPAGQESKPDATPEPEPTSVRTVSRARPAR